MSGDFGCFENIDNLMIKRFGQGIKLVNTETYPLANSISLNQLYSMPFCVYLVDTCSRLVSANELDLNIINAVSMKDIAGRTVKHFANKQTAETFLSQDLEVSKTNRRIVKEDPFTRLDEVTIPALTFKFPWYEINNKLRGIVGITLLLDSNNEYGITLANSMNLLTQTGILNFESEKSQLPGLVYEDIYFTNQEKIISYQLVRGKTAREIADNIGRSKRTVEKHLENMRLKTNSASKSELIDKLVSQLLG